MNFLMKKFMLKKKKSKYKKKKKQLRKLMLNNTMTQNHLVNVVEEESKKKRRQSNTFLPDELIIAEIISILSIKTIFRLKCVSKSWNILISDPSFVEKQLSKSSRNPHLILTPPPTSEYSMSSVVSLPMRRLLENQLSIVSGDNCHGWTNTVDVVGTCKGLLCLLFRAYQSYRFRLWNPATRTISKELGTSHDYENLKFSFGCDNLTGNYKVVAYRVEKDEENKGSLRSRVKIFSFSDKCWRNIESFPLIPITHFKFHINRNNNGVHLSGTVNWLTLRNYSHAFYQYKNIAHVEQFVIVSLDLSTETYTQFSLPSGFDEVPYFQPTLHVLMDCLCFSHDFKVTEFIIWQMKEFGVQKSWTQLFRIDYINLQMDSLPPVNNMEFISETVDYTPLLPLYLFENGDTLILAICEHFQAIIYNRRDKSVERISTSRNLCWFSSMNYVESFVSPPWKTQHAFYIQDSVIAKIVGDYVEKYEEEVEGPLVAEDLDED